MSVYKCFDCNKDVCKDCSRKHHDKYRDEDLIHSVQLIRDSFIMNCKFRLQSLLRDIQCLPNGEVVAAALLSSELFIFSVSGKLRHVIQLKVNSMMMTVMDKSTVALLLKKINSIAIVDIQQNHVQYIHNIAMENSSGTLIYIENKFYIGYTSHISVIDMSGSVKRRIKLSFTPYVMCYNCVSQHIYCINSSHSEMICIDKDVNDKFIFTDPSMRDLKDLTIDNEGNVLVLCRKEDDISGYNVITVDSNGGKSEIVIENINKLSPYSRICYDHLSNSLVIASDNEVYIYKKKA
ncbi:Hypothetical predicted protein [Mytilus galloprovincialis]|uniref:B box-type domain-containing protein n=1 Tax=Mytilus galloprovincialis TaxID=29158 RepID=A0A8B6GKL8_MYTGA|nr:Hypothetical predicted protein [Mytilus galloprovincialis]